MPFEIMPWDAISQNYGNTILLGNGASMAVSPRFSYPSLLQRAADRGLLPRDAQQLFQFFGTQDFELILRVVWQAYNVNRSLGIHDQRTHVAYANVRDCLIQTVRDIHPEYHTVSDFLPNIYGFLRGFQTVISLNYDLVVYWTMTYGLGVPDRHTFKDCFVGGTFSDDWQRFREPIYGDNSTTLVMHPHGHLALCRNRIEQESKIHARDSAGLLETILWHWQGEQVVPLFVSEGTWQQKVASIQNSYYLSTVYREVLTEPKDNLVIYGWGFGEQDLHLLQRMQGAGLRRVAVSVRRDDQVYCNRVFQTIQGILGWQIQVEFFDRESPGCWIHPR